jgi:hypothetical protein
MHKYRACAREAPPGLAEFAMTRTVITLRARFCGTPPQPGELMAAETGDAVYRIETVAQALCTSIARARAN